MYNREIFLRRFGAKKSHKNHTWCFFYVDLGSVWSSIIQTLQ